jgi:hypothetical protein
MLALYAAPIEDLRQGDLDCCACHHVAPADADVECSYAPADCQRRAAGTALPAPKRTCGG